MHIPQTHTAANCPPGLEYLTTIDQLLVKQKVELLEAFTGFETNNKFTIKNSLGQKVSVQYLKQSFQTFEEHYIFHSSKELKKKSKHDIHTF